MIKINTTNTKKLAKEIKKTLAQKIVNSLEKSLQGHPQKKSFKSKVLLYPIRWMLEEKKSSSLTPLKTLHRISHLALKKRGWQWEWRRQGEESIGLWRFKIRSRSKLKQAQHAKLISNPRRLVIIPGFGDNALSWIPMAELLAQQLKRKNNSNPVSFNEIIVIDWPGFPGHLSDYRFFQSIDGLLQATTHLLTTLEPTYLMGHSMGGWLSAWYGAKHSELNVPLLEKLIILSPSGLFDTPEEAKEFEKNFLSATENGFKTIRRSVFKNEPFWFRFFVREFDKMYQKEELKLFITSAKTDHFLDEHLQNIKVPTHLAWGENDELCLTKWRDNWINKIPKEYLVSSPILKKTGHTLHIERPLRTFKVLKDCLFGNSIDKSS